MITELEHWADTPVRFAALRELPEPVLLDSAGGRFAPGRYDIFAADPFVVLRTRGETTGVRYRDGRSESSAQPPLELLKQLLGDRAGATEGLPFCGGAIGYLGYDLGRRFERLPSIARADIAMPDMALAIYDWAVIADHQLGRSWLIGQGRDPRTREQWSSLIERLHTRVDPSPRPFSVVSPVSSNLDRSAYQRAFAEVKAHIRAGDCYQVNLTQRFSARIEGDPWTAYLNLRRINPAPFSAFLDLAEGAVLSSSPERFLKVSGDVIETRPIKGTRPRSADPARDRALVEALRGSAKDRAENVMIVDLLRNDLGRTAVPGSVRVTKLFDVESFASVHHLVSTVEARLAPGRHALDVVAGAFPGGSITGAPKVRAMQIIEALEPHRRSVYCGAIGYVGFDGNMDLNIAIRTLVQCGGWIHAWAGGGVVADSEAESEYQESLDKAAAMLAVLGAGAAGSG
jgi:para-aminobenzoate synthetase component I